MPKFLSDGIFDGSSTDLIVDGKIGIGITPSAKLTVSNPSDYEIVLETGTASHGKLAIGHFSNGSMITTFGNDGGGGDLIRFGTHTGDERMRITSGGNIGINQTNPTQKLHVDGGIRITGAYYDSNNSPGTSGQVLSSTATGTDWIDQGDIVASEADKAKSVILRVKNSTATAMSKGQVVCEAVSATPPNGNLIEVALADNNGTNTMPALGILNEDLDAAGGANDEGDAIMFGKVSGINTSAFSVGDEVFVDDTPGGLTTTKPTGVKYIQKVGVVIRDDATNGTIEVFGAGRVNDVPTPLYIDHDNQRLGIQETNPLFDLDVSGVIRAKEFITVKGTSNSVIADYNAPSSTSVNLGTYLSQYAFIDISSSNNAGGWLDFSKADGIDYGGRIRYVNSSDQFDFYTNGTTQMSIDSSGNVGINKTSPGAKLNIVAGDNTNAIKIEAQDGSNAYKSITFRPYVTQAQAANFPDGSHIYTTSPGDATEWPFTEYGALVIEGRDNTNSGIALRTGGGSGQATRIAIREGGNVGIGTTSPAQKLHVEGSVLIDAFNAGNETGIFFREGFYNYNVSILAYDHNSGGASPDGISINGYDGVSFSTGSNTRNERMRITQSGNVGIGETDPSEKLTVGDGTADDSARVYFNDGSYTEMRGYGLQFSRNASYIRPTADNTKTLYLGSNVAQWNTIRIDASTTRFETNGSENMRITSSGNVGIGTTSPSYKLDVNGGIRAGGKVSYVKTYGSLDTTGNAVAGITAGYNGAPCNFTFTCTGNTGGYQRIVYSCYCASTTWNTVKVIDEGTNDFDVEASANGTTITFTFKSTSGTKYYTPTVLVEAFGTSINSTYA